MDDANAGLLVDLYELTMAASYLAHGMTAPATFELFVRRLPPQRNFLIACGLEDALSYLEGLRFDSTSVDYLRSLDLFDERFLEYLRGFRFTGAVWAVPEGEAVFPDEPLVQVTAPMIEAQVVETFLLNCVNFQTMVASKAARISIACGGRQFVDFSPRRDHAADAALKAARAAYVGGAAATSNVLAGRCYGIPLSGTMAHSYVMAHDDEADAFRSFARDFPDRSTLLIDTFDTVEGARNAVRVARELASEGIRVQAVRLDSGDLAGLAQTVRAVLDHGGFPDIRIFASGDLDEYRIASLLASGAPIDAFGVGTQLGTSGDAPYVEGVYKLVEGGGLPRLKRSPGKASLPGRKQVYRRESGGRYEADTLALASEPPSEGRPLLERVMADGRRMAPSPPLAELRARCRNTLSRLPERLLALTGRSQAYPVPLSEKLSALAAAKAPAGAGSERRRR